MLLVKNVIVPISREINLRKILAKKLKSESIGKIKILRRSIDARHKNNLKFNFTLLAELSPKFKRNPDVLEYKVPKPYIETQKILNNVNPFIIGAGPAGLFAALALVENGFQPYIFERGDKIENRMKDVQKFWNSGILNEESNVQFGEGGAGAFSDGKLTSRTRDFYTGRIYKYLIKFGAPKEIEFEALPHLGTDELRKIIKNIRIYLESKGCRFFWRHKLTDIFVVDERIFKVKINCEIYRPEILILAVGNAARDTFKMLSSKTELSNKPFAVGVRIEHLQDFVNSAFYGEKTDFSITGPATYRLTAKHKNRGVYSFCMCPGGYVIAASSEKNLQVLNGMSFRKRDNKFANSALVVTVNEKDFGNKPLAGVKYQRQIEKIFFNEKKPYFASIQSAKDFLQHKISSEYLETSYLPGTVRTDLNNLLPAPIADSLKFALKMFDRKISGFTGNGILLAPETRTSSPIRINRNKFDFSAVKIKNLFPIGEGAGYAGGIISSATDGFKVGKLFKLK